MRRDPLLASAAGSRAGTNSQRLFNKKHKRTKWTPDNQQTLSTKNTMPSDNYELKFYSLGAPIHNHPNSTYSYPDRTRFNADTGTYVAHPAYSNDLAARDRESWGYSTGRDFAYSSSDSRHWDSKNHGK
ncbi:hypothetical protein AYL99_03201 [Fonsecaea erecta]|uniref:Uncharacterized protein n=1 Tax=Fonsecaea erecta TaxID=1367422 RepID=A0A178ZVZ9_9EURO|nr:hypothetical protein AYL99_03201 [Fonsecaea erecta]OAP63974.1 hypothetical protein AYL99_03201 [Fonsecaea erecta]